MVKRMLAFKSDGIIVYNRSVFAFTSLNYTLLSESDDIKIYLWQHHNIEVVLKKCRVRVINLSPCLSAPTKKTMETLIEV